MRVKALDSQPERIEKLIGLTLGIAAGGALIGWLLSREWE